MKTIFTILGFIAMAIGVNPVSAQTTYEIIQDVNISSAKIPSQCTNCIVNIAKGVTLTINKDIYLQNTVFNGGKVIAQKKITFWSTGEFNNTIVDYATGSGIVSSGNLKITSTTFNFFGTSTATFWSPIEVSSSTMNFLDNSSAEITSTVNLKNGSSIVAGDGTPTSKAFIKMNGGTLNQFDDSFISVLNYNNYYYNWSDYNANNKSITTSNNNINCGAAPKNACNAPMVYGPSTLNFAGVASSAVLPVNLSAFEVKLTGKTVQLNWTTDMEANSSRFEIERSFDGVNWTKTGTVDAKGNSAIPSNYSFNDYIKGNGNLNYRLKLIDENETFAYSPIKKVNVGASSGQISIFPNPAVNYVKISSGDNSAKTVLLINQNGQVIKQTRGLGDIRVSVTDCKKGMYYVEVTDAGGKMQTSNLVISR